MMAACNTSVEYSISDPDMQVTKEEILHCSLPYWYEKFKEITIKTIMIDLSEEFVDYLNSDGCFLPQNCSLPAHDRGGHSDSDSEQEEEEEGWSEESSLEDGREMQNQPSFPALTEKISSAIESLGGAVIPKLNWSSPRDATWISPVNSLKCTCAAEVYLLLKSSDFISHDLSRVFEYCKPEDSASVSEAHQEAAIVNYTLCLRKWIAIHPSSEFRCFVHHHQLLAVSQRQHCAYYRHLVENKEDIRQEIMTFYSKNIANKFPSHSYVFDVCRTSQDNYLLIDFNPFCPATDPLLFSWNELLHGANKLLPNVNQTSPSTDSSCLSGNSSGADISGGRYGDQEPALPVIRVVDNDSIQPSDLQTFRLPKDVVDLSSGEDISKFVDLFKSQYSMKQESTTDNEASSKT